MGWGLIIVLLIISYWLTYEGPKQKLQNRLDNGEMSDYERDEIQNLINGDQFDEADEELRDLGY